MSQETNIPGSRAPAAKWSPSDLDPKELLLLFPPQLMKPETSGYKVSLTLYYSIYKYMKGKEQK